MGEDKVAIFDRLVTGEAGFEQRLAGRFAVFELSKPPTTSRGIFLRVLDHKRNVRGGSGHERFRNGQRLCCFPRTERNSRPGVQ
jgi:hypothetical protein